MFFSHIIGYLPIFLDYFLQVRGWTASGATVDGLHVTAELPFTKVACQPIVVGQYLVEDDVCGGSVGTVRGDVGWDTGDSILTPDASNAVVALRRNDGKIRCQRAEEDCGLVW